MNVSFSADAADLKRFWSYKEIEVTLGVDFFRITVNADEIDVREAGDSVYVKLKIR